MSESFTVVAEARADAGKGASRRLRRLEGKIPAVIYGAEKPAQSLTLIRKDFEHMLENEACFSSILEVQVGGESQNAIIKDIQRHPAKGFPMHADLREASGRLARGRCHGRAARRSTTDVGPMAGPLAIGRLGVGQIRFVAAPVDGVQAGRGAHPRIRRVAIRGKGHHPFAVEGFGHHQRAGPRGCCGIQWFGHGRCLPCPI